MRDNLKLSTSDISDLICNTISNSMNECGTGNEGQLINTLTSGLVLCKIWENEVFRDIMQFLNEEYPEGPNKINIFEMLEAVLSILDTNKKEDVQHEGVYDREVNKV